MFICPSNSTCQSKSSFFWTYIFNCLYGICHFILYIIPFRNSQVVQVYWKQLKMLSEMILMQFDAYELSGADAFLGPFCLSLFIFIVVFIFMSVFLTIISESFRYVRKHTESKNDQHILSFMLYKFQHWLGVGKSVELDRLIERDERMRSQYVDPIENFPDKIDELFDALNRVRFI